MLDRFRRPAPKALVNVMLVAGAMLFVLVQLSPGLLVADTTPAGGDMGAHVWAPAFVRDNLLPDFRITGWTPDWYAGFPAMHFYMVVPMLAIVALDVLLPYGIAFKLVTVAGVVAMPAAAFAFGRLARVRFPGPALMAVATVLFLFDRGFTIYGGNIPSTLAGEFAFSISLAFALAFLGVLARSLETGRHRSLAAVLLALTALNHLLPAIFAAVVAVAMVLVHTGEDLATALARGRRRLVDHVWRPAGSRLAVLLTVGVVGGALGAFWALPFVWRRPYLNDMGWEKLTSYADQLFPEDLRWVTALAAAGILVSVGLRVRAGIVLTVSGGILALLFVVLPQGRLWNARLLPFWYLVIYLLAAIAVTEVVRAIAVATARDPGRPRLAVTMAGTAVAVLAAFVFVGRPVDAVPDWFPGPASTDQSFVPSWARWNYSGYERKPAYTEYHAIVTTMASLGEERGCGRAMWEYERELDRYGTPMALMLLPHWTDGCIGSMEGLYFEASATTPYHFLNQSELSANPSRPQRDLPYRTLVHKRDLNGDGEVSEGEEEVDPEVFDAGIEHLQLLGVRYYMAFSGPVVDAAHLHHDLSLVARSEPWEVFEVAGAPLVTGLAFEPVVVEALGAGGRTWQDAAVEVYQEQRSDGGVMLAADGPDDWTRLRLADALADPPRRELPEVVVSDVESDDDGIRFSVDRPGVPVLVKSSYFPNWRAEGAHGPFRVTPNLMVVVPTSSTVELSYGWTPVDVVAWLITLLGAGAAFWLWRRGPAAMRLPPDDSDADWAGSADAGEADLDPAW